MNRLFSRLGFLFFLSVFVLTGCSILSDTRDEARSARSKSARPAEVDRVGRAPASLLAYYRSISSFSPDELLQEKNILLSSGNAPDTQLRMAMVMGHPLQPNAELRDASVVLADLMQANDSVSYYLRPIIQVLSVSYNERLRLEQQIARQNTQLEQQHMRLLEAQRHAQELQEALKGLADIEISLPRTRSR